MKWLLKSLPWFFVALFGAEIVAVLAPKKDGEYHVREFGRLPVLLGGRIQPFDSVARNSLLQIRSTGDVPLEEVPSWKFWHHPKKLKSTEWLLEVMARPEDADTRPVFLIHHAELLGELVRMRLTPLAPGLHEDSLEHAGNWRGEDRAPQTEHLCACQKGEDGNGGVETNRAADDAWADDVALDDM